MGCCESEKIWQMSPWMFENGRFRGVFRASRIRTQLNVVKTSVLLIWLIKKPRWNMRGEGSFMRWFIIIVCESENQRLRLGLSHSLSMMKMSCSVCVQIGVPACGRLYDCSILWVNVSTAPFVHASGWLFADSLLSLAVISGCTPTAHYMARFSYKCIRNSFLMLAHNK